MGLDKFPETFNLQGFFSACNLFCRREKLEEDLIAIKPQNGWRGNRVNQSKVVLEWLYFEDWKLGGVSRVRHVRNGGEVKVLTLAKEYFVDSFDERKNTMYEFFWVLLSRVQELFQDELFQDEPFCSKKLSSGPYHPRSV